MVFIMDIYTTQFISQVKYFVKQLHIWFNLIQKNSSLTWKRKLKIMILIIEGGALQIKSHAFRKGRLLAELISSIICLQGSLRNSTVNYKLTGKAFQQRGLYKHFNKSVSPLPVHFKIWPTIPVFAAHKLLRLGFVK